MAPVRRVDPDLNYVWWSLDDRRPAAAAQHRPQQRPQEQTRFDGGEETSVKADRVKAYKQYDEYLAEDIPYLWLARDTWAVVAPPTSRFANPTTLQGPKAIAYDEGVPWPAQIWIAGTPGQGPAGGGLPVSASRRRRGTRRASG